MREPIHTDESLRYLRALGDPDRLHIVQVLQAGPKSVGEICRALASPIANVSHHLRTLKDAGVVSARRKGRFVIYHLEHVVQTPRPGTHLLDFGCCRIEFGEGKGASLVTGDRPDEQALRVLNQIMGREPAGRGKAGGRRVSRRRPPAGAIVNPSFEEPATPFFDTRVDGWVKEGDPSGTGVFRNFPDDTPFPGARRVVNADGEQLAAIAARNPGGPTGPAGLYQVLRGVTYK